MLGPSDNIFLDIHSVQKFNSKINRSDKIFKILSKIKSARGSCFPNCQDFPLYLSSSIFHSLQHFKLTPHSPFSSPSLFFSRHQFSDPSIAIGIMGVAAETQFHVLAVDDSNIDRKLIERLLKTSSFQVTAVDSGPKALEFLGLNGEELEDDAGTPSVSSSCNSNDSEVNLIITDYFMPGMTGYDLMRRIKGSKSCRDIPVVIMSSENVPSRINQCLKDGAEEFFLKPVRLSDVKKLRPRLLEERSHGRGEVVAVGEKRTRSEYCDVVL